MAFRILAAAAAAAILAPAAAQAGDGSKIYNAQCSACHQSGAVGVPGQFPKLAGRAPQIAATPDGRRYLATVVMYGMHGKIMVEGKPIMGVMPSFGRLSDSDLADVLTFVSRQGAAKKPAPFTAAEVAGFRRKPSPNATEIRGQRAVLEAQGGM